MHKRYLSSISLLLISALIAFFASAQTNGGDFDFSTSEDDTFIPAMVLVDDGDMEAARSELAEMRAIILRERRDLMLVLIPNNQQNDEELEEDKEVEEEEEVEEDKDIEEDKELEEGQEDEPDGENGNQDSDIEEDKAGNENDLDEDKGLEDESEPKESEVSERNLKTRKSKKNFRIEPSKPRFNQPSMNLAKDFNGASRIKTGEFLPQPFDGSGVVVGICDIGFDSRHPTFLTSDGKECRIKRVVHYQETKGKRNIYNTPEEIYAWETDNADDWHATHVTGIAAGAYPNDYEGLATGADIVFTGSQLSDVGLLAGVEDIIEYAKEVNKPCVINLSVGNTLGPHDGTSLFSRYLDYCTDDAIICISAGNDGAEVPRHMGFDFTEAKKTVRVRTTNWDGLSNTGIAQVWSRDENPFTVNLFLFNERNSAGHVFFEDIDFTDPEKKVWKVSADEGDPDYDPQFAEYYKSGYVMISGGWSYLNDRFYAEMEFDCQTDIASPSAPSQNWALYWPGIRINSEPGNHIDVFIDNYNFLRPGGDTPALTNDMSISDLATGHKVISVGMTTNRDGAELLNGNYEGFGTPGTICPNSSYGTLLDGRVLPVTSAPGAGVISSMSSAFLNKHPDWMGECSFYETTDGREVFWKTNTGTSMSCPYVVGAIATWLQAYPLLSAEEALQIITATNTQDYPDPENPRHGQGWFNAYEGLQKVLNLATLGNAPVELPGIATKFDGKKLIIGNLNPDKVLLRIYSTAGLATMSRIIEEGTTEIDLSELNAGVYMAVIEGNSGNRKVMKLFVK